LTEQGEPGRRLGRSERVGLIAIVAVALLARLAVIVPGFGRLDDPDNYLMLARSLAEGRGYALGGKPTAYRPPLYPLVLTPLVWALGSRTAWGLAALHLALGGGTVVFTALAARRWGLSPARVLAAAAIVACDPVVLIQCRPVMTETLATFLVAATLAALARGGDRGAWLGGIGFGLGALCRPSLLAAAALAGAAALVFGPGSTRARIRRGAILAVATWGMLVPWAWRNARVLGTPVWTTTHGGNTLALANNPVYYDEVLNGPPGAVWTGPNQARWFIDMNRAAAGLSEVEADRRMRAVALQMLVERPRDFARASLARLGRFWGVAPAAAVYPRVERLATAAWTIPLWIALTLGALRRDLWRWPRAAAPAVVLALTIVHAFYWTDMRMRCPAVPGISLIASCASIRMRLRKSNDPADRDVRDVQFGSEKSDRKKIQNPHGF
jgi:4-amino-4-deoxy-L-arabinose transferase-like glycosyltransferase